MKRFVTFNLQNFMMKLLVWRWPSGVYMFFPTCCFFPKGWKKKNGGSRALFTLSPIIMVQSCSVKNGCVSNRIVTFQVQPFSTSMILLIMGESVSMIMGGTLHRL